MLQFKADILDSDENKIGKGSIDIDIKKIDDQWYFLPEEKWQVTEGFIKATKGSLQTYFFEGKIKGISICSGDDLTFDFEKDTIIKIIAPFSSTGREKKQKSQIFAKKGAIIRICLHLSNDENQNWYNCYHKFSEDAAYYCQFEIR